MAGIGHETLVFLGPKHTVNKCKLNSIDFKETTVMKDSQVSFSKYPTRVGLFLNRVCIEGNELEA